MKIKSAVLLFYWSGCAGLFVWKDDYQPDEISIPIKEEFITYEKKNYSSKDFMEKMLNLRNFSLDEKCERGMDIGVGFQAYSPYTTLGLNDSAKLFYLAGIFPHLTIQIMKHCCRSSNITYGHSFFNMLDIEDHFVDDPDVDISFPIYGLEGKLSRHYKDFPFIPVVTAPRIVLLVPEQLFADRNTRTQVLMNTIFNAWPMLGFIIVSACLAGLTVWLLDKKHNSSEFPPTFFAGAWEGIWWAFVTMTTVGYGDRSPKSTLARAFCIIWILLGIMLISLFTGLVSAALSASATPVFNVAGASIGAVNGSIEFQVGVGMNAKMTAFDNAFNLISSLIENKTLHGVLVDNFILSGNQGLLKNSKLRMEREIEHPVTYGFVMKRNSSQIEKCFRKYVINFPQKTFETISKYLIPISNPVDEVRLEVVAAEKLFYEEQIFKIIVYSEAGVLAVSLLLGIAWEMFVRNKDSAAYRMISRFHRKPEFSSNLNLTIHNNTEESTTIEKLVMEYDDFHSQWITQAKNILMKGNGREHRV